MSLRTSVTPGRGARLSSSPVIAEVSIRCIYRTTVAQQRRCRERRRVPPAACAAPPSGAAAAKPRHFFRPSLLATGLSKPSDVVQHCLALFRKADLAGLRQYLPESYAEAVLTQQQPPSPPPPPRQQQQQQAVDAAPEAGSSPGTGSPESSGSDRSRSSGSSGSGSSSSSSSSAPVPLLREPWLAVAEQGPLAALAGLLDVGARRVLPGHLLRRSQVLSTLRPSPDVFQQRISLTACTGETSVFEWHLRWQPEEGQDGSANAEPLQQQQLQQQQRQEEVGGGSSNSTSGSSGGSGSSSDVESSVSTTMSSSDSGSSGRWVLELVQRDPSSDLPLPTTPHPQAAPEAIMQAQLAALQQGDVFGASCFSMQPGRGVRSRRTSLGSHHSALRAKLAEEPYRLLLRHAAVQLGAAVLPTQRDMLQEVAVLAPDGTSARFVWRLTLASHSCWMASAILTAEDAAAALQAPHG